MGKAHVACLRDALNDALLSLSDTNASFMASLVGCRGGVVSGKEC